MKFEKPLQLKTLAEITSSEYIGDPDYMVSGINEIHMVEAGDITFVDHPKYYEKALNSKATTIIINQKVECPKGKALLFNEDPFSAYLKIVYKYRPFEPAIARISPSATIGKNTIIQPGAFIGNHVVIGDNCLIHANVSIYDHSVIGDDVIIHSNSVIGADAYYFQRRKEGLKKFESCGRVLIENRVEIGALCSVDKGVSGDTIISEGTKLDNHVQIGHDTFIGRDCLIGAYCAIAGVTRIEDDVLLWGRVAVNKDLVVGKGAIVLATSAVDKSLPGNKTYYGSPAVPALIAWREKAALRMLPELIKTLGDK